MRRPSRKQKSKCHCVGKSGRSKHRYATRQAAINVALRRHWVPSSYPCPAGGGFHLTHDN